MAKKKILVVDDEPIMVKLLKSRLTSNGYEVICASDGLEACRKAGGQSPDLILLDLLMPKMDGFETGSRLKADHKTKSIPIIILSARDEHRTIVEALTKIEAADYLVKPFKPEVLLEKIKNALENKP